MKKLITLMMSLLIMTTMMGTGIHADDSIGAEGDSATATVGSDETLTDECVTDEDVFRVTVSWNISPGTYARNTRYSWNAVDLKYDVKKELTAADITTTDGTAEITLTNYSNTDVDYAVYYESKKVDEKAITSEEPTTTGTDIPYGTIASADSAQTLEGTGNTYKQAIYNGTISYADDYMPENEENEEMGEYSVKISKHLTLDKTTLTIKTGRTYTSLKASTPVTWSSSNENVATVDENGKITTIADGTANIIATSKVTGMTATCKVTVASSGYYFLNDCQEDFDLLLATDESEIVSYTDPETSKTVYAYNGFVKETRGANWYQAQSFVKALNDNNIKPTIAEQGTEGTWRILKSCDEAAAWANATNGTDSGYIPDYKTRFEGINTILSSAENGSYGYHFACHNGSFGKYDKSFGYDWQGFVAIWEPAN